MRKIFLVFIFLFVFVYPVYSQKAKVKLGIEVLEERNFDILQGKNVGLITNPTGTDSKLKSTIDILFENERVNLVALFGPEHGVRGNVEGGEKIENYTDGKTGLPVYSLYGKNRKPTAEMLEGIDVLVYDIQDIGARSYTFISTLGLAMEAAAENNIEFVVLDRPNPLCGNRVEGNIVEDSLRSFIGKYPVPYVYGLTCGELAKFINGENLLGNGLKCKLTVVPMQNWTREMTFDETGLLWIPTSPHIPTWETSFYYVMTGILGELRNALSIGVGYTLPFKTIAAEWIDAEEFARKMNEKKLIGMIFRPIHYTPYYAFGKGKHLNGVQIHITDFKNAELMNVQFIAMEVLHELYPEKNLFELATPNQRRAFDRAVGSTYIREMLNTSWKFEKIKYFLDKDVKKFREISEKYFLYK